MKMFIWEDPYPVYDGGSRLVAVAETAEDALDVAFAAAPFLTESQKNYLRFQSPDYAHDLPCAEWFQW